MAGILQNVRLVRSQAQRYGKKVRELGPWLVVAVPFWLWTGRRAYQQEMEHRRQLRIAPVAKSRDR